MLLVTTGVASQPSQAADASGILRQHVILDGVPHNALQERSYLSLLLRCARGRIITMVDALSAAEMLRSLPERPTMPAFPSTDRPLYDTWIAAGAGSSPS